MENAEEIFHFLEEFSKRKPKTIPQELNDYLAYVARTGDPVYQWPLVKSLFKEKLLNVITDFYETSPGVDIPPYPNVDPFNYDIMKNSLLERLDSFTSAPFTVQRICELLTYPRKQYNRIDKYMRAIEKNILVVSTREPGQQRHVEPENADLSEPIVNGSDNNSDYNVDVEMEDMSWKDNVDHQQNSEPQAGSSDAHITADNAEARLQSKQNIEIQSQEKTTTQHESVTPPELNMNTDEQMSEVKTEDGATPDVSMSFITENKSQATSISAQPNDSNADTDVKTETGNAMVIPEIKIDDTEITEKRLIEESSSKSDEIAENTATAKDSVNPEIQASADSQSISSDESSSDSNIKDEPEPKHISEMSNMSEESSSSSDNTDGNSNSPKTDSDHIDTQEETNQSDTNIQSDKKEPEKHEEPLNKPAESGDGPVQTVIESDHYTITDVNSELPQSPQANDSAPATVTEPVENNDKEKENKLIEKEKLKDENNEKSDESVVS